LGQIPHSPPFPPEVSDNSSLHPAFLAFSSKTGGGTVDADVFSDQYGKTSGNGLI
jgi:hypothetical protein